MTNTYARAYTEVLEILSHFSKEEYSKIPAEKIEFYKKHMDKDYCYTIGAKDILLNQNISREASAILVTLFRDHFASEKEKQRLEDLLKQNQEKLEKEKAEKYSPDIFKGQSTILGKNVDKSIEERKVAKGETAIIEYKSSPFRKILNKIKEIFMI